MSKTETVCLSFGQASDILHAALPDGDAARQAVRVLRAGTTISGDHAVEVGASRILARYGGAYAIVGPEDDVWYWTGFLDPSPVTRAHIPIGQRGPFRRAGRCDCERSMHDALCHTKTRPVTL